MVKEAIWLPEHSSLQHDWVCISLRREGLTFAMAAQEVDREASQGHVNQEQLRHMPYTEACVKEALRLYPPATALARQLTQDMQIMGHSVPKGTGIFVRPPSLLPVCPQRVVHVPQACRSILSMERSDQGCAPSVVPRGTDSCCCCLLGHCSGSGLPMQ